MTENDLHQYQLQAVDHIISHTHCALFLDMGLGKTVSTLTAINELMFKEVEVRRVLVIAPKRVAESVWTQEVEKWDHLKHIKVSRIIGTERQRREALAKKADIYTIGRDNVAWLCGLYGGSCLPFDMVVIDELSSFKNPKSIRFKALKHVQASLSRVVGLTGTPAPNGLMDLGPKCTSWTGESAWENTYPTIVTTTLSQDVETGILYIRTTYPKRIRSAYTQR